MSFPADDVLRMRELASDGFSACAIARYMDGISLGTVRTAIGKQRGHVLTNDNLSVRQRSRYLNWQVIRD